MQKIKLFLENEKGKDILIIFIIILVGLGSFGLGRLSKKDNEGLKIEYRGQEANILEAITENMPTSQESQKGAKFTQNSNFKKFFASSKGSKYYTLDCSGGKTIKEENKIFFTTREEAETAGYELSSYCR